MLSFVACPPARLPAFARFRAVLPPPETNKMLVRCCCPCVWACVMARRTTRRWRCFVVSSQQQRRAQGRCANEEEDDEDDEDEQQQPGATMVLSSTEEIVYRFLGFAQATRPRTCSPFHQVRAYVRSSCSSSFLPSPTSPLLSFWIDCSSSPSLLLQTTKEKKHSPCLLACLFAANKKTGYSNLLSFSTSFLFSSYFFRLGFRLHQPCRCSSSCSSLNKQKKGKTPCLLAANKKTRLLQPTLLSIRCVLFSCTRISSPSTSSMLLLLLLFQARKEKKRKGLACLLACCQ